MAIAMQLDELIGLLDESQKQTFQELCKQAAKGPGKKQRKGIGRELSALLTEALLAGVDGLEPGEAQRSVGPMMGAFWKRFQSTSLKPKQEQKTEFSDKELRRIAQRLPYPLSYKLGEFLWEHEKFEKGYGSSNFPFLLASLNGLALRLLAIVAIIEYTDILEAPEASVNRSIVEGLRMPADGTWKQLIDLISKVAQQREELRATRTIGDALKKKLAFKGAKKGLAPQLVLQDMIQFRNQLLHGTHYFSDEEIATATRKIRLLYGSLAFLAEWRWGLKGINGIYELSGLSIKWKELGSGVEPLPVDAPYGEPLMVMPGENGAFISLWPLLHFSDNMGEEFYFFNGIHDEHLEYISYRFARSQDHRQLSLELSDFYSFLRKIPVASVPVEARLDFSGVAEFHRHHFVGRQEILAEIFAFFEHPSKPYGIIRALAGMGKTAIMAMLYSIHHEGVDWPEQIIPIWHFCGAAEGRNHPVIFLRSVLAQLDACLNEIREEYPTSIDYLRKQLTERIGLIERELPKGKRILFVVDALDEALDGVQGTLSIPSLLPAASELPDNCNVFVSYRVNESGGNEQVETLLPVASHNAFVVPGCDPLAGLSRGEVEELLELVIPDDKFLSEATIDAIWNTATSKQTHHEPLADPFVLRFIADGIEEGSIDPDRAETVPKSLSVLFDQFWNALPTTHDFFLQRILGMLSIMPDMGSDAFFADLFTTLDLSGDGESISPDDVAERRIAINKLLVFTGPRYRLFHGRFQSYVQHRFRRSEQAKQLLLPLLEYCRRTTDGDEQTGQTDKTHYGFKHQLSHLRQLALHPGLSQEEREEFRDELWEMVWDERYFQEKFELFQRTDLLMDDFLRTFDVFEPREHDSDSLVWTQLARSFHLCKRANLVISRAMEQSQHHLIDFAQRGDGEQVVRIALWAGNAYRRMWLLLLGAVWMYEAQNDPARVFSVLFDIGTPSIAPQELPAIQHLLERADAPDGIKRLIHSWVVEAP